MVRKWHKIRDNKANFKPKHILYIDTETNPEQIDEYTKKHQMRLGWTCYARKKTGYCEYTHEWKYWNSKELLCQYMYQLSMKYKCLHIIASNALFDIAVCGFIRYFADAGFRLEFSYSSGMSFILVISRRKHRIKVLSTQNWFPVSVKELGRAIGLEKGEIEFSGASEAELKEYCRRDTEIIQQGMEQYIKWLDAHDYGNFRLTRASQAFGTYRHRFLGSEIVFHAEESVAEAERESYFGGRVEAFKIGDLSGTSWCYADINSMYPFVMQKELYPVKLVNAVENPSFEYVRRCLQYRCAIAKVDINTDEPVYARYMQGRTCFPVGRFTSHLTTPELKYALDNGHIERVHVLYEYTAGDLFSRFISHFYDMRLKFQREGDSLYEQFCKFIMNSLYGKFGQRVPICIDECECDVTELTREVVYNGDECITEVHQKLFGVWKVFSGEQDTKNTFTAIAGHVTAYGRMLLWHYIQQVGLENVVYCDTDSLIFPDSMRNRLSEFISPSELGKLAVEQVTDDLIIHGCKDYRLDGEVKMKGIRSDAVQIGDTTYIQEQWCSLKGLSALGINDGYIVRNVKKTLSREYKKGEVHSDGRVEPFTVSDVQTDAVSPLETSEWSVQT
jgi:hypothetical protein